MVRIRTLLNALVWVVVLLGVAPLYPYLGRPVQIALPLALLLAVAGERRPGLLLRPGLATLLSFLSFGLYAVQISRSNLVEPVINILGLLIAVRLLTEKSGRNYLQLFLLSLFALAASSLVSLSVAFFFFLIPEVVAVIVGLVLLCFHAEDPGLGLEQTAARRVLGTSLLLPAGSLLLMLFFFVILPRTQQPLWNFLNPAGSAVAGLSESVEPGSVSNLAAARTPVFRAESEELRAEELYWRAIVLNRPQGRAWVRQVPRYGEEEQVRGGRAVNQAIFVEARRERFLPVLDTPRELFGVRARNEGDRVFVITRRPEQRLAYTAISLVGGELQAAARMRPGDYLQLPAELSPRLRAAGERIGREGKTAAERIALTEALLVELKLSYATKDLPRTDDPLDEFLFSGKRGYCEYFASAFALLLRQAGVPTRLVGGYLGGDYNRIGGYYLVTDDKAHVWVEALVDGRWRRFDPSRLANNAGVAFGAGRQQGLSATAQLLDAIDYYWTQSVITFDLGSQFELLQRGRGEVRKLHLELRPGWGWLALPGGILLAVAGWWSWRWWRTPVALRLLKGYRRAVARRYGEVEARQGEGLETQAQRLADPACAEFAELFGGAIYRDRSLTREEERRLRLLIGEVGRRRDDPGN